MYLHCVPGPVINILVPRALKKAGFLPGTRAGAISKHIVIFLAIIIIHA
jgi:hypothetical protein